MWRTKKPEEAIPLQPSRDERPLSGVHDLRSRAEHPSGHPGGAAAHLGRTLSVKGELAGNEELILDGEFEGTIELGESSLTVGPQGRVQADIRASQVIIEGTVKGTVRATDRLQICKSGHVVGDLVAARIVIEDGAYVKGSIDIQKPEEQKPRRAETPGEALRITPAPVPVAAKDKLQ